VGTTGIKEEKRKKNRKREKNIMTGIKNIVFRVKLF
jgi:hypothetical protein